MIDHIELMGSWFLLLQTCLFSGLLTFCIAATPQDQMNGIQLSDYPDFHKNWNFVTARYRKDTTEMRFTYANDIAMKALLDKTADYPDGAVFAKFSAQTRPDIDFPSSMVPRGKRRIQFMVRDKKKFKSTFGWGYALFDKSGKVFPGDLNARSKACAACHKIVEKKGHVFSEPMYFLSSTMLSSATPLWKGHLRFKAVAREGLPQDLKGLISIQYSQINFLTGEIQKNLFSGSLDELRPMLIEKVKSSGLPAVVVSTDESLFSLVTPAKESSSCMGKNKMALVAQHTVGGSEEKKVVRIDLCETRP